MRWTGVFGYLSAVVVTSLLLSLWLGWTGWLLALSIILVLPLVAGLAISSGHPLRWSSLLALASSVALLGALIGEFGGWIGWRDWLLFVWTVFLLAVAISLFSHPMRRPAWGLFVGFWGAVAAIWLIVLQTLAVGGLLHGSAYSGWVAWPVAIIGLWILVAAAAGFGETPFGRVVDLLGLLTGAGLLSISIASWSGAADLSRTLAAGAALVYSLWSLGFGWALWRHDQLGQLVRRSTSPHVG